MSARKLVDDCFVHDRDRLRHDEVIALLKERLHPVVGSALVPLTESLGRVLAADCTAPRPIPAHDNAAVDGFAVRHEDLNEAQPTRLPVHGRVAATIQEHIPAHLPGSATRIFTNPVSWHSETYYAEQGIQVGYHRLQIT